MKILQILNKMDFIQALKNANGEIYLVGGIIRDHFINKESKDIDLLIRNIELEDIKKILKKYGRINEVGISFGVLKYKPKNWKQEDIDIALPRTDKKEGEGHKGIKATSNPYLPLNIELERRDFTINSIALSLDGNIIDPFNGIKDIKNGIIKATSKKAFHEDPLRMLRAIQFAARFGFKIEDDTWNLIQNNADKIKTIPGERVAEELVKIYKKGDISLGLDLFVKSKLFKHFFGFNKIEQINLLNDVKILADLFFIICKDSTTYKIKLRSVNNYNGIDKDIDAISQLMKFKNVKNIAEQRHNVFNAIKRSKNVLNTGLFKNFEIQNIINEFKNNIMPKNINELDITGHDLINMGFSGVNISKRQKFLLNEIFNENRKNIYEDLIKY